MGYGVTVALQILILSVKVRILMGQQTKRKTPALVRGFFFERRAKLALLSLEKKKRRPAKQARGFSFCAANKDH